MLNIYYYNYPIYWYIHILIRFNHLCYTLFKLKRDLLSYIIPVKLQKMKHPIFKISETIIANK